MGDRSLILAGVKAGGTAGSALAMFAPPGTVLPTAATGTGAALDTAFADAGWCSEDGLKKAVDEQVQTIGAFGTNAPVRKLITSSETTFEIVFLESNPTALSLYHRLPLTGPDAIDVAADGSFSIAEGEPRTAEYSAVFDLVDGPNRIRAVVPQLEVTGRQEFSISKSSPVQYGVTLTAYPGPDNIAIEWHYLVAGLATP
ncbi:hypothetical protein AB0B88_16215 [Micromonospora haikouensis]|uniref:phage tail tube protein n=1 Tax=Actinomycetes TaxID=1760 RepID=UPI0033D9F83D